MFHTTSHIFTELLHTFTQQISVHLSLAKLQCIFSNLTTLPNSNFSHHIYSPAHYNDLWRFYEYSHFYQISNWWKYWLYFCQEKIWKHPILYHFSTLLKLEFKRKKYILLTFKCVSLVHGNIVQNSNKVLLKIYIWIIIWKGEKTTVDFLRWSIFYPPFTKTKRNIGILFPDKLCVLFLVFSFPLKLTQTFTFSWKSSGSGFPFLESDSFLSVLPGKIPLTSLSWFRDHRQTIREA